MLTKRGRNSPVNPLAVFPEDSIATQIQATSQATNVTPCHIQATNTRVIIKLPPLPSLTGLSSTIRFLQYRTF